MVILSATSSFSRNDSEETDTDPDATLLPGLASADEAGVSREIHPHPPSEFDVTLMIHNISIGGMVETLPEDVSFIGTPRPSDRFRKSGQKIAFAVVNDTTITYRIHSMDTPEIAGICEDFLNGVNGTIGSSAVHSGSSPRTQAQKSTPGFEALLLIAVLLYLKRG